MSSKLTEAELEIVRRFYDYDLDESELDAFSNRLEQDTHFALEVEQYNLVYHAVAKEINQNRTSAKRLENNKSKISFIKNKLVQWVLLLVTLAIIAGGLFYFLNTDKKDNKSEILFAEVDRYVSSMRENGLVRSGEANIVLSEKQLELKQIISNYSSDNYAQTIDALNTYIQNTTNPNYQEIAYWEKVFIYSDIKDIDNTRATLQEISEISMFNSAKKAKSLLEKL